MSVELRVQWVSCTSTSAPGELRAQCQRLCEVDVCSPRHVLAAAGKRMPHVVVFEFEDPTAEQLQLLQAVKRAHPSLPILMVTSAHSEELAVWAFRTRVWNYLVTPVPLRELKSNLQHLSKIVKQRDKSTRSAERPGTILPVPTAGSSAGRPELAAMRRFVEHIREDHGSRLSIGMLASQCGMSRFSFSRVFRSNFGCSCREYIMRQRIQSACRMLEAANSSVTHVAFNAGFSDASYFARLFRKYMKTSPAEYARTVASRRADEMAAEYADQVK